MPVDFWPTPNPATNPSEGVPNFDPVDPDVASGITDQFIGVGPDLPLASVQYTPAYYNESAIDSDYITDEGLLQVPVCGPPGTPCEIIAVHAPMCKRRVVWTAERNRQAPTVPSPNTNNPNEILAGKRVRPTTPAILANGAHIYRLSGNYEYYLLYPPGDQDNLSAGTTAYETASSSSNDVQPSQFDPSLLDSSSTVPQGFVPPIGVG